jgi:hypothetical protein
MRLLQQGPTDLIEESRKLSMQPIAHNIRAQVPIAAFPPSLHTGFDMMRSGFHQSDVPNFPMGCYPPTFSFGTGPYYYPPLAHVANHSFVLGSWMNHGHGGPLAMPHGGHHSALFSNEEFNAPHYFDPSLTSPLFRMQKSRSM